jgi:hypothetical protein
MTTTATAPRRALAALFRVGVLAALGAVGTAAQAQDLGLMLRIAQAQPGAAVVLAQLHLGQAAKTGPAGAAKAPAVERRALQATTQPALAFTAVAAAAARPPVLVLR